MQIHEINFKVDNVVHSEHFNGSLYTARSNFYSKYDIKNHTVSVISEKKILDTDK